MRQTRLGEDRRRHLLLSELLSTTCQREDVPDNVLHGYVSAHARRLLLGVSFPVHIQSANNQHLEVDEERLRGKHILSCGDALRNLKRQ